MNNDSLIEIGHKAPDFCLLDQDSKPFCLRDFLGKWVILNFYPDIHRGKAQKDTWEFSKHRNKLERLNAITIGVTSDPVKKLRHYSREKSADMFLLSDKLNKVFQGYKTENKTQASKTKAVLINPDGMVHKIWNCRSGEGYAEDVVRFLTDFKT